ncbi:MAG: hypothetical protein L7U87_00195 [Chlamydiales bacterium]|nr:hypothetical protein [Chlamydiales bacterium]
MTKMQSIDNPYDLDCQAIIQDPNAKSALIYFTLTADTSLVVDPFNQPVKDLKACAINCFSVTLPFHDIGIPHSETVDHWRTVLMDNGDFLESFVTKLQNLCLFLEAEGLLKLELTCLAGLSRGGYIACFLASLLPQVQYILAFSPMSYIFSREEETHLIENIFFKPFWNINYFAEKLANRHLQLYIGNYDTKVSTRACFEFTDKLASIASEKRIRPCKTNLHIYPSVGHKGHGTPPDIFHLGAQWIEKVLL